MIFDVRFTANSEKKKIFSQVYYRQYQSQDTKSRNIKINIKTCSHKFNEHFFGVYVCVDTLNLQNTYPNFSQ